MFVGRSVLGLADRIGWRAAAYLLVVVSFVVIVVRPDCSVVAKVFYASYAAAGFTFLAYAAVVATKATRSISEALTASLLILLDLWRSSCGTPTSTTSAT